MDEIHALIQYVKSTNTIKDNEIINSELKDFYEIKPFEEFMNLIEYDNLSGDLKHIYKKIVYYYRKHMPNLYNKFISNKETKELFNDVYVYERWGKEGGGSGCGSTMLFTMRTRIILDLIIYKYNINSICDVSCGSMEWLSTVLTKYNHIDFLGCDASQYIINKNKEKFKNKWNFTVSDFSKDSIGKYDLIICRDTLQHNNYKNIYNFFENIKKSGSKYLLLTNYSEIKKNADIHNTECFSLNLLIDPFNIPESSIIEIFDEETRYISSSESNKYLFLLDIEKLH